MIAGLGLTVVLYAAGVGLVCAIAAARAHPRPALVVPGLMVLEIALALQVASDLVVGLHRHRPPSLATHLGYAIASLVVLPAAAGSTRLDESRWGSASLAVGSLVAAIVSVRLHQTLGPVRA